MKIAKDGHYLCVIPDGLALKAKSRGINITKWLSAQLDDIEKHKSRKAFLDEEGYVDMSDWARDMIRHELELFPPITDECIIYRIEDNGNVLYLVRDILNGSLTCPVETWSSKSEHLRRFRNSADAISYRQKYIGPSYRARIMSYDMLIDGTISLSEVD